MAAPFAITLIAEEQRLRLGLTGEFDLAAVPAVREAVASLLADPAMVAITVDLSATTFLDSSGIGELIRSQRQAHERGVALQVTGAHGNVAFVLELTGLAEILAGAPDPTEET